MRHHAAAVDARGRLSDMERDNARGGHWDVEHGCGTHGGVDKAGQLSLVHPPRRQAHMTEGADGARREWRATSTPRRPLTTRRKRRDLAYGCTNR